MKTLKNYVEDKNRWEAIFGNPPLDLNSAEDRQKIARAIDSELSPENLSCDGELPHDEVMERYRRLAKAADQLRELDSSVKFYEH